MKNASRYIGRIINDIFVSRISSVGVQKLVTVIEPYAGGVASVYRQRIHAHLCCVSGGNNYVENIVPVVQPAVAACCDLGGDLLLSEAVVVQTPDHAFRTLDAGRQRNAVHGAFDKHEYLFAVYRPAFDADYARRCLPLRIKREIFVWHRGGVAIFLARRVLPTYETIAVARRSRKNNQFPNNIFARGKTSVTAVEVERDRAVNFVIVTDAGGAAARGLSARLSAFVAVASGNDACGKHKATHQRDHDKKSLFHSDSRAFRTMQNIPML